MKKIQQFFSGLWFYVTHFRTIRARKREVNQQNKIYEAQAGRILESKMLQEEHHGDNVSDGYSIDW